MARRVDNGNRRMAQVMHEFPQDQQNRGGFAA